MNFNDAVRYIESELKGGCYPGLERINNLLGLIGNPHIGMKAIHVAGTNGKGSVVAMISSILVEAGYKVGRYISPHLINIKERYTVNNKIISEKDFTHYTEILKEKIDLITSKGLEAPSQFEMLTALAFLYMKNENVDIAVIEVGLGGRYDATNLADSILTVITSIGFDHMSILGDTVEKIAYEKAGIIKKNNITVLAPQKYPEAVKVVEKIAMEQNNRLVKINEKDITSVSFSQHGQLMNYHYNNIDYKNITLPLLGDHQLINASVAIASASLTNELGYNIRDIDIIKGLKSVSWQGRLSIMSHNPLIVIDGAHNEDGIQILKDAICKYFPNKRLILVMGMLKDKEHDKSLKIILPIANTFIATEPISDRALSARELGKEAKKYIENVKIEASIIKAIEIAKKEYTEDSVICIAGSLYLIGEVLKLFN